MIETGGGTGAVAAAPCRGMTVAFLALVAVAFFTTLGLTPMSEPDEARYAEISREMLESGDWVTPHLNYVKYFEKPPLVGWLTALSMSAFGSGEFVVRLWPALFGLVGLACAWILARDLYGTRAGLTAAAILSTCPLYFALSQVLILDMPLSGLMTVALTSAWFVIKPGPAGAPAPRRGFPRTALVLLFHAAAALAVLTKGPVALVLLGGILVAHALLQRSPRLLLPFLSPSGLAVFALIVLPWFVLVSARNPEFLHFFIVDQHINRYLNPSEHRESVLYFVPILLGGMMPWTILLGAQPRIWSRPLQRLFTLKSSAGSTYLALWAALIFVFFSLSGSKLPTYILPVFCPLAVLAAGLVSRSAEDPGIGVHRWLGRGLALLGAASLIAAVVAPHVSKHPNAPRLVPALLLCGFVLAAFAWGIFRELRSARVSRDRLLAVVVVGMLALQAGATTGRRIAPHYTNLARVIRETAGPADRVVVYAHYTQGIPYYATRRVVMVRAWGELDFGSRQGDQSAWFWKEDSALFEAWRAPQRTFLVINRNELDTIRAQLDPVPREIAAQGKKVLVVNFPE